jgi:hypothetical protein
MVVPEPIPKLIGHLLVVTATLKHIMCKLVTGAIAQEPGTGDEGWQVDVALRGGGHHCPSPFPLEEDSQQ